MNLWDTIEQDRAPRYEGFVAGGDAPFYSEHPPGWNPETDSPSTIYTAVERHPDGSWMVFPTFFRGRLMGPEWGYQYGLYNGDFGRYDTLDHAVDAAVRMHEVHEDRYRNRLEEMERRNEFARRFSDMLFGQVPWEDPWTSSTR